LADIQNEGYRGFFEALVEGRLVFGQTLRQDELGDELGMSLSPLRETTTLLETDGLVTVRRRVGITVFTPDVKFIRNTFQFRGFLEREGLRRFARAVPAGWVRRTRKAHKDLIAFVQKANDEGKHRKPVRELEAVFHGAFIGAFDNDEIATVYNRLISKMYLIRLLNPDAVGPASTVHAMREHLAIIDALERADPDGAADGLDRHLRGVLHRTLG
jgi:DNA-binding GntR family transcriptional regulator